MLSVYLLNRSLLKLQYFFIYIIIKKWLKIVKIMQEIFFVKEEAKFYSNI